MIQLMVRRAQDRAGELTHIHNKATRIWYNLVVTLQHLAI
uniref:Uncharacterized protein n=1 Tax=Anguilla anguilla TaxID=7936 RepID=A0A0E9XAT8_ANGAN